MNKVWLQRLTDTCYLPSVQTMAETLDWQSTSNNLISILGVEYHDLVRAVGADTFHCRNRPLSFYTLSNLVVFSYWSHGLQAVERLLTIYRVELDKAKSCLVIAAGIKYLLTWGMTPMDRIEEFGCRVAEVIARVVPPALAFVSKASWNEVVSIRAWELLLDFELRGREQWTDDEKIDVEETLAELESFWAEN